MSHFTELEDASNPLNTLVRCRESVRVLCNDLERLADQLGQRFPPPMACRSVLRRLRLDLPLCHRNEELLYKLMVAQDTHPPIVARCIELAIAEHARAEICSIELAEPLGEASEGLMNWNPDALGYLLRHSFETILRHLDWEDAAIFRQLPDDMSRMDLRILCEGFQRNFTMLSQAGT